MTIVAGGRVLVQDGWRDDCDVATADGRIVAIGPQLARRGAAVVDARGLLVAPGFVDVHVHGAGGAMFEDGSIDANRHVLATLAPLGTTGLLATVAALPPERLLAAVAAIAAAAQTGGGARVLGIHLEGPFLSPRRAGAQNPDWMRSPSVAEFAAVQRACGDLVRLVTVAPELPGALAFITAVRQRGVRVALGHSEASAAQVDDAIAAGATQVTHLFNAMAGLHHRAPGLVGVGLDDARLAVEVIADGVHVDPRLVRLAARCKSDGGLLLVSDGVAAVGAAAGPLTLFGAPCMVGDAVRRRDDGRLAGSCLTLARAVANLGAWLPEWPRAAVLGAGAAAPARALGLAPREAGALVIGAPADVVLLDPSLCLRGVLQGGRVLHSP